MILSRRRLISVSAATGLTGCGAISAVSRASDPLDTYTLTPLAPCGQAFRRFRPSGRRTADIGGELATDRILIKVSPRQAEYLPKRAGRTDASDGADPSCQLAAQPRWLSTGQPGRGWADARPHPDERDPGLPGRVGGTQISRRPKSGYSSG